MFVTIWLLSPVSFAKGWFRAVLLPVQRNCSGSCGLGLLLMLNSCNCFCFPVQVNFLNLGRLQTPRIMRDVKVLIFLAVRKLCWFGVWLVFSLVQSPDSDGIVKRFRNPVAKWFGALGVAQIQKGEKTRSQSLAVVVAAVPSLGHGDCMRPKGSGGAGAAPQVSGGSSRAEPGVLQRERGWERAPRAAAASPLVLLNAGGRAQCSVGPPQPCSRQLCSRLGQRKGRERCWRRFLRGRKRSAGWVRGSPTSLGCGMVPLAFPSSRGRSGHPETKTGPVCLAAEGGNEDVGFAPRKKNRERWEVLLEDELLRQGELPVLRQPQG